jgi:hypothetical protein
MPPGTSLPDPRVSKGLPLPSPPGLADQSSRDGQRSSFPLSSGARNLSAQALGLNDRQTGGSPPLSPVNTDNDQDGGILLQPETRPITQEQLVNEVKGVSLNLALLVALAADARQESSCQFVVWLTFSSRNIRRPSHGREEMRRDRPAASCNNQ